MRIVVLDPLARQHPGDQIAIEFAPPHAGDFFPSLAGQDQELDERPERIAERVGGPPDQRKLAVIEHAIALPLRRRRLDPRKRRRLDRAALEGPVEYLAHGGQYPVGLDGRAAVDD